MKQATREMALQYFTDQKSCAGIPAIAQKLMAAIIIFMLSPVLILTVILIKMESKGPVIFSQVRVGKYGRRFVMYKFRSMYLSDDPRYSAPKVQSSRQGICTKYQNDPRVTRVGRVIRKYSIDELPQLFNVLWGDMYLVGPRPALVRETEQYKYAYYKRLEAVPGLTGLWQVSGRADTTFEEQLELDYFYVDHRSLIFDVSILFKTIPTVLFCKGAY